jgi:PAS domain-containing protein
MNAHLPFRLTSARTAAQEELAILISPDFEILMMHPGLERLWKRSPSDFLGKKCYEEMEKRDRPCPGCPGVVAMRTGRVAEGEGTAVLDDGTKVPFFLRAYPIMGPGNKPGGWVEVVENLAARWEGEEHARFQVGLLNAVLETSSLSTVLQHGLAAALQLQAAESGCAFRVDSVTGLAELVVQHGVPQSEIGELTPGIVGSSATLEQHRPWLNLTLPVVYRGRPLAALVLRLPADVPVRPESLAKLEALACILAAATARLRADGLRGDASLNTKTILDHVGESVFCMDQDGRITGWNTACERLFGWSGSEVIGGMVPFAQDCDGQASFASAVWTSAKQGSAAFTFTCQVNGAPSVDLQFRAASLRDVIGDGTAYAVFTKGQSPLSRTEERNRVQPTIEARILGWIERGGLRTFSLSECYQALRRTAGVASPADIRPALESLVSSGRITRQMLSTGSRAGRPHSPMFLVEPTSADLADTR